MSSHPTFPSPTIQEALCEIHFKLSEGNPWTQATPGDFFQAVQTDYPKMEPATQQGFGVLIGPDGVVRQEVFRPTLTLKFVRKDNSPPTLIQLSDRMFTLNVLSPYPTWEVVKKELLSVWPKFRKAARPDAITRIGLRYINRIPRRKADEPAGYWFKASPYVPGQLRNSPGGFAHRLEVRLDQFNRVITSIVHDRAGDGGSGSIVFDIDRIVEKEIEVTERALDDAVEILHTDVWSIFNGAKSANYDRLLNEGGSDATSAS